MRRGFMLYMGVLSVLAFLLPSFAHVFLVELHETWFYAFL